MVRSNTGRAILVTYTLPEGDVVPGETLVLLVETGEPEVVLVTGAENQRGTWNPHHM